MTWDSSASIAGSIVVGGNATYSNPTIHGGFSVGGNLTLSNWGTVTGPIVTGGTFTNATGLYASYGSSVSHGSVAAPIDFSAEATALRSISTSLGGVAGTNVSPVYGTLTFTGGAGVDVFWQRYLPAFERWWADLGHPTLTPALVAELKRGVEAATAGRSGAELAAERDEMILRILAARSGETEEA